MITATFLDEISHDIPSANWGRDDWGRDFAAMREVGIDTVVLIRAGYKDRATFDSSVLRARHPHLIVQDDLVQWFLDLAQEHGMGFWFGTYDSGEHWMNGDPAGEAAVNRDFCDEFVQRYGDHPALAGWYLCHEIHALDETALGVYQDLSAYLKGLRDLPILISPYLQGPKQFGATARPLAEHAADWREVFGKLRGQVDVVAFQDGNCEFKDLPEYLRVNAELAREHGIACWSNVENFDRDVHIKFPPIAWPKLRFKMEAALAAGVDKLLTFEWSHFMSPHSMFPSARNLHARYVEWLAARRAAAPGAQDA